MEGDISRCRRCKDRNNRAAKKRRRKDPEYQRRHNRAYSRRRRKDPEYNQKMSEWRKQRSVDGKCRQCADDAQPDSDYCMAHEIAKKIDQKNYKARKKLERKVTK